MAKKFEEPHYTDNLEALNLCDLQPKDHRSGVDLLQDCIARVLPTWCLSEAERDSRKLRRKRRKCEITCK